MEVYFVYLNDTCNIALFVIQNQYSQFECNLSTKQTPHNIQHLLYAIIMQDYEVIN